MGDRQQHPEKYNNQIKNQMMYVRHGFTEFFSPSPPINDHIEVIVDNQLIALPELCRSLKLVNINSAMNGCFFWGAGKSRDFECEEKTPPRLDDSQIEVMGTRGVHDMLQHRVNVSHAQRIAQTNDVVIRFKRVPSEGMALQIDGEAWLIRTECELRVQIHDKLPVVIGYAQPRGVEAWLTASLEDAKIVRAKTQFRERLRQKYETESAESANVSEAEDVQSESESEEEDKEGMVNRVLKAWKGGDLGEHEALDEIEMKEMDSVACAVGDSGLDLDKFGYWKMTRKRNHLQNGKAMDAEAAKDAIASDFVHDESRKTQSCSALSTKGRSASLF